MPLRPRPSDSLSRVKGLPVSDALPLQPPPGLTTLAIDIGGSHLKAGLLSPQGALSGDPVRVATPAPATPATVMSALAELLRPLGTPGRLSAGFPGVVRAGVVLTAPNLGTKAWHGFPLAERLGALVGAPARVLNDASVQGLGVIGGRGLECVITLGTGMGFALFQDGVLAPHLELSQHPVHGRKTYDAWIGDVARQRIGDKRWAARVVKVIGILRTLINFDHLLIGGGNGKHLKIELPAGVRIVPNQAGITGGEKLWAPAMDATFDQALPALHGPIEPG